MTYFGLRLDAGCLTFSRRVTDYEIPTAPLTSPFGDHHGGQAEAVFVRVDAVRSEEGHRLHLAGRWSAIFAVRFLLLLVLSVFALELGAIAEREGGKGRKRLQGGQFVTAVGAALKIEIVKLTKLKLVQINRGRSVMMSFLAGT